MAEDKTRHVVTLHGDLDFNSAPGVRAQLLGTVESGRELCADMSEVSYVDSTGIACLLEVEYAVNAMGGSLSLAGVSKAVMRTLGIARMETVFTILETRPPGRESDCN